MKIFILIFACWFTNSPALAQTQKTVFTTRGPESETDQRQAYYVQLLDLALKKTSPKYGPYQLNILPTGQNIKRAIQDAKQQLYPNYFVRQSVSIALINEMKAVEFPLDLGIAGYRVGFVNSKIKARLENIDNKKALKKLTYVQGLGWLDNEILRANGFKVMTASSYEGMFSMIALNRIDIFMRGVHEIKDEWENHLHLAALEYDETFAFYYPLPRFFFTAKANQKAAKRVYEGLVIAYEDHSLTDLWLKFYGPSLAFARLEDRKIYQLSNPFIDGIDPHYQTYIFRPQLKKYPSFLRYN